MGYSNLFNRLLFSLFFFAIFYITFNNKQLLFIFGTFIYLCVLYEVLKFFKNKSTLILFYLITSYFFFSIYFIILFDYILFNLFVFTIILFDSFSYFTGNFYGKKFILKSISPKKTLEGYLGGIFLTNISIFGCIFFMQIEIKIFTLAILLNCTIFFSIIGDLIESYFKRKNNIKDSSKYLPGHGGFFDRFDSLIASIIFLTIFSSL